MDNKTPPAWATLAALRINSGTPDEDAFIIQDCSPDAEALAEALEKITERFNYIIDFCDDGFVGQSDWDLSGRAGEALAAYRACFPKAEVTP